MKSKKELKILYISDYFPPYVVGGSEISTSLIVKFVSKKFKCYVLTSKFQDSCWRLNGATVYPFLTMVRRVRSNKKSLPEMIKLIFNILFLHYKDYYTVQKFIKEHNIDLIHTIPSSHFFLVAVISSIMTKKPVIIDVRDFLLISETAAPNKKGESNYRQNYHNIYTSKFRFHDLLTLLFDLCDFINIRLLRILLKKLIKKSNKVKLVAISKFMKRQLIKAGFPKEKIEVIYNIADKNILKGKNYKRQNQIVFAGRLEKIKGIWDAIKAFELIGDNKLKFAIAGAGTEFENIKYYLKSKSCSNIKLLGIITNEQVLKLYNISKVIVCPSIWPEPLGRFVLESFATETPIITTNVGALPETIKNRETGIIIEPNNPIKLAEAIKELLTNKKLYDEIAKNLAKEAEKYSPEVIGKQRILLYKKILKKNN